MKKILITLLALAGVAAAETLTFDLSSLNTTNTLIGGSSNNALVTSSPFDNATDFATLTNLFVQTGKWYASSGYNINVGTSDVPSSNEGVVLVAGGPSNYGRSTIGGIEFGLTASQLSQFDGPLTFSFEIAHHYGNDKSNHQVSFYLLTDAVTLTSPTYNTTEGDNLLKKSSGTASPFYSVTLSFNAEQVAAMQATGENQTFAFVAYSDAVTGSIQVFL